MKMAKASIFALALAAVGGTNGFISSSSVVQSKASSTSLHAFTPPTMIIGPMIRKMREEKAKKKMPMATQEEAQYEAKWPPVWPFDSTFFKRKEEIENQQPNIAGMAGLLTGQVPDVPDVEDEDKFKPLEFWGVEHADST